MKKVIIYSILLLAGLIASQFLPKESTEIVKIPTMIALSFIMIHVGLEFDIDRSKPGEYLWDYVVAGTAAAFPWLLCAIYFTGVLDMASWQEALLLARFSSPTSAGILFSMLAAAGLAMSWTYQKARVLAIFDDLDTVLLMIPLKFMIIGFKWELLCIVFVMFFMLWLAWRYLHALKLPTSWPWVLFYSVIITSICEGIYLTSKWVDEIATVHLEVLLPAFVLGCMLMRPKKSELHNIKEEQVSTIVAAIFMVLVGLSMPRIEIEEASITLLSLHVLAVTLLSNLGKMFPLFCYRKEASVAERLALSISMFPRGEVGAGVLVISLGYGLSGVAISVAVLSLALNLVLTGFFIVIVKKILDRLHKVK